MVSGTHDKGPFAAQPASGKKLSWGSFRFYRIAGTKVVDTWAMQDRLGLMQQLGLALPRDTGVQWADGAPAQSTVGIQPVQNEPPGFLLKDSGCRK